MRNGLETSKKGYSHLPRHSHPQWVTRISERRHVERLSAGSCVPTETLVHYQPACMVRRKLARIITKLGALSEQRGLLRFLNNTDHASALNGFVQDLAYTITDYQVCVTKFTVSVILWFG